MRITTSFYLFLALSTPAVFALDDQAKAKGKAEFQEVELKSNLLGQLGFSMVTVKNHLLSGREVIALPIEAVFQEKEKTFVVAQRENKPGDLVRWEVQLGQNDGRIIEAKNGVVPGDKVLVKRADLVPFKPNAPVVTPIEAVAVATNSKAKPGKYGVQIGVFSNAENANRVADKLKASLGTAEVLIGESKGKTFFHVRGGEYTTFKSAGETKDKLIASGFPDAVVVGEDKNANWLSRVTW